MIEFHCAADVKRHLKERGFTDEARIKRTYSPFSGNLLFSVSLKECHGALAYSFGSREPIKYAGEDAPKLYRLNEILRGTNAFPSS